MRNTIKKAYQDIRRFMTANGFDIASILCMSQQKKLTTLDVIGLMEQLAEQFPWLSQCVNEIDVTNIGVQHSLKHVLENASKPLDVDLSEISLEPLPKIERPNPPTGSRATRKKSRSPER